jgi:hypothetical protein
MVGRVEGEDVNFLFFSFGPLSGVEATKEKKAEIIFKVQFASSEVELNLNGEVTGQPLQVFLLMT